jgi:CPA2 family monovalent cation:H+ antiporter-2
MVHIPELIIDLALILAAAAIVSLVFKKLKQPIVLGYIIAGFLVGPHIKLFPTVVNVDAIKTWADIGVIFLLFSLGLEFSFKKLMKIGGVATITAIIEVTFTMLLGFSLGKVLGWNNMNSLFLGGILAIASTTIIIRAFDELGVKDQKFAGVVTGVLVIEDLVAVLLMVLLSTVAVSQTFSGIEMVMSVLKLAFFLILWFVSGIFFLPSLLKRINHLLNEEILLIISISLCLLMVILASYAGFSSALGAFIMGSILAETTKAEKIEHLTKSVKNLFASIFFVSVGMLIEPSVILDNVFIILGAVLVLLIGKPIFVVVGALASGQPLKIAIQSGMSLSQIGEFSFIIATLGLTLKVTNELLYPLAVAVSVVTAFTTPYMIRYSVPFYNFVADSLPKKWKNSLDKYSAGTQNMAEISDWKHILRFYLINVVIFSVIIISIILLSTKYLSPFLAGLGWSPVVSLIITLIILTPFLWALALRRTLRQAYANVWLKALHRGPLVLLLSSRVALAVLYLGFLFYRLFTPEVAMVGILVTCGILLIFSGRIKAFYGRIENRFLINYNERETPGGSKKILAPWDTHITTFQLNEQSPYIGRTLLDSRIREEFGVNIVVIERGDYVINVPNRDNYLYPYDKLSVIGTDEQLQKFKFFLESYNSAFQSSESKHKNVSLHHITLGSKSSLLNNSILQSKIRERTQGLVVGVERNGRRILNPESNLVFELNDKIWIVGNEKRIQLLFKEFTGDTQ